MLAMAIRAVRGIGVVGLQCLTVEAVGVNFPNLIVAVCTVHPRQWKGMFIPLNLCIFMAGDASILTEQTI